MNKRIRELLAQCTQESIDGPFASPYVDQEKFAELIVQECAELAGEETSLPYGSYSEKIKKHFGVEE